MLRLGVILASTSVLGCGSSAKPVMPATTMSAPDPSTTSTSSRPDTGPPPPPPIDASPGDGRGQGSGHRCDTLPVADISVDGLMYDLRDARVVARVGSPSDGAVQMRCAWDGW